VKYAFRDSTILFQYSPSFLMSCSSIFLMQVGMARRQWRNAPRGA
jgi:hypothetical protein